MKWPIFKMHHQIIICNICLLHYAIIFFPSWRRVTVVRVAFYQSCDSLSITIVHYIYISVVAFIKIEVHDEKWLYDLRSYTTHNIPNIISTIITINRNGSTQLRRTISAAPHAHGRSLLEIASGALNRHNFQCWSLTLDKISF